MQSDSLPKGLFGQKTASLCFVNLLFLYIKPEYQHRISDNVRQKIELCPMKTASKRAQLSGLKLQKQKSHRRLKTLLLCFFLLTLLIDNSLMQFLYILNRTMCLSKNILCKYFVVVFCHVQHSFSSKSISHGITQRQKNKENINQDSLLQERKITDNLFVNF